MAIAAPPFPIARISVEQYHRMIESGAFNEHDPVELIEGWLVQRMAKGPGHEYATGQLEALLRDAVPPGWHVRNQAPVTLSRSEPEPDLAIVRGSRADYRSRHPAASDVALVVEVADTTLATDRAKAAIYAACEVAEYWIVNLVDRRLEVYTNPGDAGYAESRTFSAEKSVELVIAGQDARSLRLSGVFP